MASWKNKIKYSTRAHYTSTRPTRVLIIKILIIIIMIMLKYIKNNKIKVKYHMIKYCDL